MCEMRALLIDNYIRLIARYEIKFELWARSGSEKGSYSQPFCGLPAEACYRPIGDGDVYHCAIILPAYTAEDALTDLKTRLTALGWLKENIMIHWIQPTEHVRAELERKVGWDD